MNRFGYNGIGGTCHWCGKKLPIDRHTREPTDNELGELRAYVEQRCIPDKQRWFKHPEFGRVTYYGYEGIAGISKTSFRLHSNQGRVGIGYLRNLDEGPPGSHKDDSPFCTNGCAIQFAERMVELGQILTKAKT